jgi:hypothetical protein
MPSSIRSTPEITLRPRPIPEEVVLWNWPLRDEPLAASLLLTLAAGAGWLTIWATASPWLGAIIVSLLAITLWRTILPVRFELGSQGIVQTVLGWQRRTSWLQIARFELLPHGVIFCFQSEASPLATLTALYMRWRDQRDQVLAILDFYLPHDQ